MTILAKADANFVETTIDDEVVLMNIETGNFHAIEGTGLAIWRLIDGVRSIEDIVGALRTRYAIADDACRADVDSFAARLASAGLVIAQ